MHEKRWHVNNCQQFGGKEARFSSYPHQTCPISIQQFALWPRNEFLRTDTICPVADNEEDELVSILIDWAIMGKHSSQLLPNGQAIYQCGYVQSLRLLLEQRECMDDEISQMLNSIIDFPRSSHLRLEAAIDRETVAELFAILNEQPRVLTPRVVNAVVRLLHGTGHFFGSWRYNIVALENVVCQLAMRTTDFFIANGIRGTIIQASEVNHERQYTWLSQDTVWATGTDIIRNMNAHTWCGYSFFDNAIRSLLIALLILRTEGKDPFGKLTKIGIFDPYKNLAYTLDITTLHPTVYNDILNTIYR